VEKHILHLEDVQVDLLETELDETAGAARRSHREISEEHVLGLPPPIDRPSIGTGSGYFTPNDTGRSLWNFSTLA